MIDDHTGIVINAIKLNLLLKAQVFVCAMNKHILPIASEMQTANSKQLPDNS